LKDVLLHHARIDEGINGKKQLRGKMKILPKNIFDIFVKYIKMIFVN